MPADLHLPEEPKGVVVFFHGYKGFKDWGCWNLVAQGFAEQGWAFFKANFSHNGTTPEAQEAFADLDAFAANTYSKEVNDGVSILDFVVEHKADWRCEGLPLTLIGHSRGGGIAALVAARHSAVNAVVAWAAVSDFGARFPVGKTLEEWKSTGVYHVHNARTGQDLPHSIEFYNDFIANEEALTIRGAVHCISAPMLIVHASDDEAVHVSEAFKLGRWAQKGELRVFDSGGHTFGATHPWESGQLPAALEAVCTATVNFIA